jgi:hypothetical protein
MVVVPFGTSVDVYPPTRRILDTADSKGVEYPSIFEYRLKGPVSAPAVVNVINTDAMF